MFDEVFAADGRRNVEKELSAQFVIVGGGIAGVCAAINAARNGVKVCLVQDRPVLGGNASSEVRLWVLGATSHMGNNNRWSREGGIMDEILLENLKRNKEGNAVIFDTVLLELVKKESNITLLLNTSVYNTIKDGERHISAVEAFCPQNSTYYRIKGEMFCDASGDGIVAFQSGASFRMGAESRLEFDEQMAPLYEEKEMLGHSIYFYSKDVGKPVEFVKPAFADINDMALDRIRRINPSDSGSRLWWIEYGGNLDTIHQTEDIKWELWKVVYGIWDHIKNSGEFENVENLTLEWVGTIPGKRESRRFNGLYMLKQQDIIEQKSFDDAVSYGGWAIDHHPGDGVYSDRPPCQQFHTKGIYQIPLRSLICLDIDNLFLAGRVISASHVAFGSTRVMATSGHGGQAVGMAAAICLENDVAPSALIEGELLAEMQSRLNEQSHFIPKFPFNCPSNLAKAATLLVSSTLSLSKLHQDGEWTPLDISRAQLLPLEKQVAYSFKFKVRALKETELVVQMRRSAKPDNYTPEVVMEERKFKLHTGVQTISVPFSSVLECDQYAFVCFLANQDVLLATSGKRVSGVLSVANGKNKAVSNNGKQTVESDIGVEEFEFWIPERRPKGKNIAFEVTPSIECFNKSNLCGGYSRPYLQANAWVADFDDKSPEIFLSWDTVQKVSELILHFDTDFDHALESTLWGHPESRIPFCVNGIDILNTNGELLHSDNNNYQTVKRIKFAKKVKTSGLLIKLRNDNKNVPVSLFQLIVK